MSSPVKCWNSYILSRGRPPIVSVKISIDLEVAELLRLQHCQGIVVRVTVGNTEKLRSIPRGSPHDTVSPNELFAVSKIGVLIKGSSVRHGVVACHVPFPNDSLEYIRMLGNGSSYNEERCGNFLSREDVEYQRREFCIWTIIECQHKIVIWQLAETIYGVWPVTDLRFFLVGRQSIYLIGKGVN